MSPIIGCFLLIFCFVAKSATSGILTGNMSSIIEEKVAKGKCKDAFNRYIQDLRDEKLWALKIYDASAKLQSGILSGNSVNLGDFIECLEAKSNTTSSGTIRGKYCLGKFTLKKSYANKERRGVDFKKMTWGMCIPDACQGHEVEVVYNVSQILGMPVLDLKIEEDTCQTFASVNLPFDASAQATIIFLSIILGFLTLSTLYELYNVYRKKHANNGILVAFSAVSNWRHFSKTNSTDQLHSLNGLRLISMAWIILLHEGEFFLVAPVVNQNAFQKWGVSIFNMFRLGGVYAVETFFVISGFLVAYSFAKNMEINLLKYYTHRYLRLTPALAATVLVAATLVKHLGSGPYWRHVIDVLEKPCQEYWWTTLLYVQNYSNVRSMCLGHAWYLAVDMQLFFVSPILLYVFKRSRKVGYAVMALLFVASVVVPFKIAWDLQLVPFPDEGTYELSQLSYNYYFMTHTRAAAWILGFICGQIVSDRMRTKWKYEMSKITSVFFWFLSLSILSTCIFIHNFIMEKDLKDWNNLINSLFLASVRPAWSLSICWIIYACVFGQGGWINSFLSLPAFQILSKLTYSMYVTHFVFMHVDATTTKTGVEFGSIVLLGKFLSRVCFSLLFALVWIFCFEYPITNIERYLMSKKSKCVLHKR